MGGSPAAQAAAADGLFATAPRRGRRLRAGAAPSAPTGGPTPTTRAATPRSHMDGQPQTCSSPLAVGRAARAPAACHRCRGGPGASARGPPPLDRRPASAAAATRARDRRRTLAVSKGRRGRGTAPPPPPPARPWRAGGRRGHSGGGRPRAAQRACRWRHAATTRVSAATATARGGTAVARRRRAAVARSRVEQRRAVAAAPSAGAQSARACASSEAPQHANLAH